MTGSLASDPSSGPSALIAGLAARARRSPLVRVGSPSDHALKRGLGMSDLPDRDDEKEGARDEVDEAGEASFPASDPPSFGSPELARETGEDA